MKGTTTVKEAEALRTGITSFMKMIDRRQAHGEAQFAVLEAALHLLWIEEDHKPTAGSTYVCRLEAAMGAVRAAVVATNIALLESRSIRE